MQRELAAATATYRLQLRGGLDFGGATVWLPHLADLGISHLYLSPPFTAQTGSTHGYDIIRPDELDPALGGRPGFERLAAAAAAAGIALVIDIVPNHTAFSFENPWLRDVLRRGRESGHARHFDIDWQRPLILPFLPEPLDTVLAQAPAELAAESDGPVLRLAGLSVPLDPGSTAPLPPGVLSAPETHRLIEAQVWQLAHWALQRDTISHRRFFDITQLIGMRIEDPAVFEDMHALVFELVEAGLVKGLRIDHVDGLADPVAYLEVMAARLPGCPIWVEKILAGDERLDPGWPVAGTTGYETVRAITGVLGDPAGVERLTEAWRAATGRQDDFAAALREAKAEVIRWELAAELLQLVRLGLAALAEAPGVEAGAETVREAVRALLTEMPRYRTYFTDAPPSPEDLALWAAVQDRAAASLRDDRALRALAEAVVRGATPAARRFRVRFQQVSGALAAKALEDTAGFRYTPYLAANEVGADPGVPLLAPGDFAAFCQDRLARWPAALTLTSSHDTKRSEDARMRLVAIGHCPDDFLALHARIAARPDAMGIEPATLWYLAQSAVAIWEEGRCDLGDRLARHMQKAMREAKERTYWVHPVRAVERPVQELARRVMAGWADQAPGPLRRIAERAAALSLCQLALKLVMPGIPDIYRGTEAAAFALTDPDNRLPVAVADVTGAAASAGLSGRKARLLGTLLARRRARPDLFLAGTVEVTADTTGGAGVLRLTRRAPDGTCLSVTLDPLAPPDRAVTLADAASA